MVEELVEAISTGQNARATELFEQILFHKILERIEGLQESLTPEFRGVDLVEALKSKFVVRKGRLHRKWSYSGGEKISIKGKKYAAKVAEVNPMTGKRIEAKRTEAQVRNKIIKMKRLWKTTMRAKLPQLLRNRLRSMKIAKALEI